jgi:hypothetical protein
MKEREKRKPLFADFVDVNLTSFFLSYSLSISNSNSLV